MQGTWVLSMVQEDSTYPGQLGLCITTSGPTRLRALAMQQEKPPQWEDSLPRLVVPNHGNESLHVATNIQFIQNWKFPVQVRCRIQDAWGWCTGMTQRDGIGREVGGGSGWGTCVHPWWIHVDVWQNQYNIVISLQLKLINLKLKKALMNFLLVFYIFTNII